MARDELQLCPVTGWAGGTLPGSNVLLDLEYIRDPSQLTSGARHQIRFAMTAAQALQLAALLQRMAAATSSRPDKDEQPPG